MSPIGTITPCAPTMQTETMTDDQSGRACPISWATRVSSGALAKWKSPTQAAKTMSGRQVSRVRHRAGACSPSPPPRARRASMASRGME